ncbi:hypothetical protein M2459_002491 [Parabacteroides sp. PF5-5]|uniref:hypothetical protein n=1 Tax=unclassified Parabacteroides TaxID=2649774 RepID=UPI0024733A7C|nr:MULTISPECIES: hypothetical protein [unclassified Parabacteroides]MDH6305753.1 hypothetical protein [Parabacteroides sp. PH5-39]MDH6316825.1 hypothetical protein [Parabacteroides sp. PF5-13]MDH6320466.1 hypothetical protein [Parabacteroides sp. PH5-13]MDH6324196.1 hypothetical protein [Parabacteroides sp. PH5-8]MDH6328011.1 hypothetical protein [Parabacteroides sp. PH5-41]
MEKNQLIHRREFHLIKEEKIHDAVGQMVDSLGLAAGSTDGFDIYKVVKNYFTSLDRRHEINNLLDIPQDSEYFADKYE